MKLTLGLCLLFTTGVTLADTKYTIKSGDTIEVIAQKHGVRLNSILSYNGLKKNSILKIGRTIVIPTGSKPSDKKSTSKVSSSGGYSVRNGDQDWTIAKRHGISVEKLHAMNPGVKWRTLQIGQKLQVPGTSSSSVHPVATKSPTKAVPTAGGTYTLKSGDNDWLVARRFSTTPKVIRQLNPNIRWDRAQVGTAVRVPATATVAKSTTPKLRARYAVVTGSNVMVRERATTSSDAITKVQAGTRVTVLGNEGAWYKLRFPHGTAGWVRGDFLKAANEPIKYVAKAEPKAAVKGGKAAPVAKTKSVDDEVGYITHEVVSLQQKGSSVDKILTKARSMRGVRYRWGAASRSATDCSGFTTQVFKSTGISLPRTSGAQAKVGTAVSRKNLKAGDLVFFKTTRGSRISHVGIYVGSGKFIHASSGGGRVMESSLTEGYYSKRFVTARRLVKTPKVLVQELKKQVAAEGDLADPDPVSSTPTGQ
jgi:cell wall-associated NlpC family hydrolase